MIEDAIERRQGVVAGIRPSDAGDGETYASIERCLADSDLYAAAVEELDGGREPDRFTNGERELLYGGTLWTLAYGEGAVTDTGIQDAAGRIRSQDWGGIVEGTDVLREAMLPEHHSQVAARYTADRDGHQQAEIDRYGDNPGERARIGRMVADAAGRRFGYARPAVTGIVLAQFLHPISIEDKVETRLTDPSPDYVRRVLDRAAQAAYPDLDGMLDSVLEHAPADAARAPERSI
ncbi:MAG: hypothetical protein SVU88_03275 [Candidatus Nanohaloarchaea archaeon]|nr:hypothetical protein [Candidatus Nanohaloarchaea archaeon]